MKNLYQMSVTDQDGKTFIQLSPDPKFLSETLANLNEKVEAFVVSHIPTESLKKLARRISLEMEKRGVL